MSEPERIGDGPVEETYAVKMQSIARVIDEYLNGKDRAAPRQHGFVLMMFPMGDHGGWCNYMSNADRADIMLLLKEQLARFEGGAYQEGHG